MPATATYATTGNAYVDGLLGDRKWAIKDLTFRFPTNQDRFSSGRSNGLLANAQFARKACHRCLIRPSQPTAE
jgi:serralysin